jgi:oligopeptide/dipeptide ABC transporter ATP-binding protein
VDGVDLEVYPGETVAVVGESGCGKTMTAFSILRLVPPPGRVVSGTITFRDREVLEMDEDEIRDFRGNEVAMIFQDPMSSLNPVTQVGPQIEEAMTAHTRFSVADAARRVVPLLKQVRVPAAEERIKDYPHQFSGGMRQRAMIAMGLANEPALLIADEPTTALDVTVQAQVIQLLKQLNQEFGTAIMLITHNMALVASICTRVIVMYAGRVVEEGPVDQIFQSPQHPYTWSLLQSVPRVDAEIAERLVSIKGLPPDMARMPPGCKFHPRCRFKVDRCLEEEPTLDQVAPNQLARCWVLMKTVPDDAREELKQEVAIDEGAAVDLKEMAGDIGSEGALTSEPEAPEGAAGPPES